MTVHIQTIILIWFAVYGLAMFLLGRVTKRGKDAASKKKCGMFWLRINIAWCTLMYIFWDAVYKISRKLSGKNLE